MELQVLSRLVISARQSEMVTTLATAQVATSIPSVDCVSQNERRDLSRLPKPTETESLRIQRIQKVLSALKRNNFRVASNHLVGSRLNASVHRPVETSHPGKIMYEGALQLSGPSLLGNKMDTCNAPRANSIKPNAPLPLRQLIKPDSLRVSRLGKSFSPAARAALSLKSTARSIKSMRINSTKITKQSMDQPLSLRDPVSSLPCTDRRAGEKRTHRTRLMHYYIRLWHFKALNSISPSLKAASAVLQQTGRFLLATIEYQRRSLLRTIQFEQERQTVVGRFARRREMAARVSQAILRGILRAAKDEIHFATLAATTLQHFVRDNIAKRSLDFLVHKRAQEHSAVVEIQRHVRGNKGRDRFHTARAAAHAMGRMKYMRKLAAKHHWHFKNSGAAIILQERWRKRMDMRQHRFTEERMRTRKADIIRRSISNFNARAKRRHSRDSGRDARNLKFRIAIWVQSQYRQKVALRLARQLHFYADINTIADRKHRTLLLNALPSCDANPKKIKDIRTESYARQWSVYMNRAYRLAGAAANARIPHQVYNHTKHVAVTRIAAAYRAHCCVTRIQKALVATKIGTHAKRSTQLQAMALVMQRLARRWMANGRALVRHRGIYVIKIQKTVRGIQGRAVAWHVRSRRVAAVRLQAIARKLASMKAHGPQFSLREHLNHPTRVLQALFRRFLSARLIARVNKTTILRDEKTLQVYAVLSMCHQTTCTELCTESYTKGGEYKGEFQAVFAHYCRAHPVRHKSIDRVMSQQNCLDAQMTSSEFVRLFKDTPNVVLGSKRIKANDLELVVTKEKKQGHKNIDFSTFLAHYRVLEYQQKQNDLLLGLSQSCLYKVVA